MEWKEYRLKPKENITHIKEDYENICENCELEIDCEECNVSIPLVVDEFEREEVIIRQNTLCGIPIGYPYEVKE